MLHLQLSRETNGISQLYLAMYFNETCKQVTVLVLSYPQFIVVEISHWIQKVEGEEEEGETEGLANTQSILPPSSFFLR